MLVTGTERRGLIREGGRPRTDLPLSCPSHAECFKSWPRIVLLVWKSVSKGAEPLRNWSSPFPVSGCSCHRLSRRRIKGQRLPELCSELQGINLALGMAAHRLVDHMQGAGLSSDVSECGIARFSTTPFYG